MKTGLKKAKKEVSFEFEIESESKFVHAPKTMKKALKRTQSWSKGNDEIFSLKKVVVIRQVVAVFQNGKRIK